MQLIVTTNTGDAAKALAAEVKGIGDWSRTTPRGPSLWSRLAADYRASRLLLFESGGRYDGSTPWVYNRAEREHYVVVKSSIVDIPYDVTLGTVLRWPGYDKLMHSFVSTASPYNVQRSTPTSAAFGSRLPWAASNQYGIGHAPEWFGGHKVPARDMLSVGPQTIRGMERTFVRYIVERIDETTERVNAAAAQGMRRRGAR